MKAFRYLIAITLGSILLGSCSTSKVHSFYVVDESKIKFNTFSFYARKSTKLKPLQKELDSLIELMISTELIRKGFRRENYSDVYVDYKITLGTSSTSSVNRPYYNYIMYPSNYNINTTHYKEGVLLIELSTKEDKLLWQGSKSFKVRKSINTKDLFIDYVREIIISFKPNL